MDTSSFKNGLAIIFNGEAHIIVYFQHVKPGKGGAFVRTKLKNIRTGATIEYTFRSGESVEPADLGYKKMQYLYTDDHFAIFMDNDTFEQKQVERALITDKLPYLKEGEQYDLMVLDENPIGVNLPIKIKFKVTEAPEGVKGDTSGNATKTITIENGMTLRAPLFIKEGEYILVNTETGDYVERSNN